MRKLITIPNIIFLCLIVGYYVKLIVEQAGFYVYPLDDSYIHLSIAKHFALDGIWGVTAEKFTSTSSSPLFTFLEAILIKLFGVNDYYPLAINIVGTGGLFWLIHRYTSKSSLFTYALILTGIVWFTPLYVQILIGMEHVLHICFMVGFLFSVNEYLKTEQNRRVFIHLLIWASLASITRYESLFIIFPTCVLLASTRKLKASIILGLVSIAPIILYGLISVMNGSYFLPNSILLKGNTTGFDLLALAEKCITNLGKHKHMLWLLVFLVSSIMINIRFKKDYLKPFVEANFIGIIVVFGILFHSTFAAFGWVFRYEAYLIVLSLLALSPFFDSILNISIKEISKWQNLLYLFLIPICFFMQKRFKHSRYVLDRASINIYEQHYQIGAFLAEYYNETPIVAGDIGAITYYSDIKLLDLFGLGSIEIAEMKRNRKFYNYGELQKFLSAYTEENDFEIAIIYDKWVHVPPKFVLVGQWKIKENRVAGGHTVKFFAVGEEKQKKLRADLEAFNQKINKNVQVRIFPPAEIVE